LKHLYDVDVCKTGDCCTDWVGYQGPVSHSWICKEFVTDKVRSGQVNRALTRTSSLCNKTVQGRKLQVHKCFTFIFAYEMVGITNKVYHMSHCFSNKWVLELLLQ
jgi:hypothetical protein